jgi:hypothetical protein
LDLPLNHTHPLLGNSDMVSDMMEFKQPIPVILPDGKEGYAIYVTNSGMYENDVWTVVHCEGGIIRHYATDQLKVHHNATFGIRKTTAIY